jgi:hypothetical protein
LCGHIPAYFFLEDDMPEIEMTNDVETEEEFTDELSDEALDRQLGGKFGCAQASWCGW